MPEIFEILETAMILCFGASWPFNVVKSWKTKSAKGKSLLFLILILTGYVFGICSKFLNETYMANIGAKWYVIASYFFNFIMVFIDFLLYFRNCHYDKVRAAAEAASEKTDIVSEAVASADESIADIAETVSEIESAMEEIRDNMKEISQDSSETNESAE